MRRKVINQIIPHLRLMFMLLITVPSPIGNGEQLTALKHESHRAFGDLHLRRRLRRSCLEYLVFLYNVSGENNLTDGLTTPWGTYPLS